jgi:hypothetical protein
MSRKNGFPFPFWLSTRPAAVALGDRIDAGQPQPGTALGTRPTLAAAVGLLEQARLVDRGNPAAFLLDLEKEARAFPYPLRISP